MLQYLRRRTPTRYVAVVVALLALLVGQGVRLCLHAANPADTGYAQASAVHLESNLPATGEPDDDGNRHVSLGLAVVKQLTDGALAILLTVALAWLLPPLRQAFAVSRSTPWRPFAGFRLRPPLRAPPL